VVREESGLDALYIYRRLPLVCVYAFEHVWFAKNGVKCKWQGTLSADEEAAALFAS